MAATGSHSVFGSGACTGTPPLEIAPPSRRFPSSYVGPTSEVRNKTGEKPAVPIPFGGIPRGVEARKKNFAKLSGAPLVDAAVGAVVPPLATTNGGVSGGLPGTESAPL